MTIVKCNQHDCKYNSRKKIDPNGEHTAICVNDIIEIKVQEYDFADWFSQDPVCQNDF
jgi:hypothetical protein